MSTNGSPYDNDFFEQQKVGALRSARIVVPVLLKVIKPRSVIDIGCGHGAWLRAFQENGVQVIKGLDGLYVDQSKRLIDPSSFSPVDLSRPFKIDESYDLITCLEVAEHLPERVARALIKSLTETAPLVLFSAAVPGQPGLSDIHINEQWPSYWQVMFQDRGFRRLDPIRPHIWHDDGVEWWYRQNIYLYASEAAIMNSISLQAERELACTTEFELVHRSIFYRYESLRGIIREVPRVARRKVKTYLTSFIVTNHSEE
jgi:SAM-dependent methyltransferase